MSIQEATRRRVEEVEPDRSQRVWTRGMIAGGAAVILLVSALVVTAFLISGDQTTQPTVRSVDSEAIMRDLVNRGLIPSQALEPASLSREAVTRDLVNRGLIPSQALEPASPSREAITRDLVNRGLIPKQTLNG